MCARKTRFRNIGFLTSVGVLFMGVVIGSVVIALFAYVLLGLLLIFGVVAWTTPITDKETMDYE